MFCNKCGKQLPDNAVFCNRCGNRVTENENSEFYDTYYAEDTSQNDSGYRYEQNDVHERRREERQRAGLERVGVNKGFGLSRSNPLSNKNLMIGISVGLAALIIGIIIVIAIESKEEEKLAQPAAETPAVEAVAMPVAEVPANVTLTEEFNQETTEQIETPVLLSDGPIFFKVNELSGYGDVGSFSLMLYSLKTGEEYEVFHFENPAQQYGSQKYSFSKDLRKDVPNFFRRQLFDSKLSRIAVSWKEESDGSVHVGWVDKNGNLTDVTSIVHPTTSGFSSIAPQDGKAYFTADDKLAFFDGINREFCYYDENEKRIVETYTPDGKTYDNEYEFNMWHNTIDGLDLSKGDNRPINSRIYTDEFYYSCGDADDVVKYGDELVFLEIKDNNSSIAQFGPGASELHYFSLYDEYYYWDENAVVITPETDYRIENLAYGQNLIVFTATKGDNRALFKMSYNDRVAGEPELITYIDNDWGDLYFWEDESVPAEFSNTYATEEITEPGEIAIETGTDQYTNKDYKRINNFKIQGKWKNVGSYTFGQIGEGGILVFDGTNCNLYSPADVYAFYQDGDDYTLECTGLLSSEPISFTVKTVDKNNIDIYYGDSPLELTRVK